MTRKSDKSASWYEGEADAFEDNRAIAQCPAGEPIGPQRPPGYPNNMYHYGYAETFDPSMRHICTDKCRKKERNEDRRLASGTNLAHNK